MLLAVVVAHLAYMASPLHGRPAMTDEPRAGAMTASAVAEASAALDARTARDEHAGHCIIEWLKLDQRPALATLAAATLAAVLLGMHLLVPGRRPIARALGPPSAGDPQALLQVFRL
jgi:hypothetical protein